MKKFTGDDINFYRISSGQITGRQKEIEELQGLPGNVWTELKRMTYRCAIILSHILSPFGTLPS